MCLCVSKKKSQKKPKQNPTKQKAMEICCKLYLSTSCKSEGILPSMWQTTCGNLRWHKVHKCRKVLHKVKTIFSNFGGTETNYCHVASVIWIMNNIYNICFEQSCSLKSPLRYVVTTCHCQNKMTNKNFIEIYNGHHYPEEKIHLYCRRVFCLCFEQLNYSMLNKITV